MERINKGLADFKAVPKELLERISVRPRISAGV
jgi:hypothetical protein